MSQKFYNFAGTWATYFNCFKKLAKKKKKKWFLVIGRWEKKISEKYQKKKKRTCSSVNDPWESDVKIPVNEPSNAKVKVACAF